MGGCQIAKAKRPDSAQPVADHDGRAVEVEFVHQISRQKRCRRRCPAFDVKIQHPVKPGDVLHSPDNPDQSCGMVMTAAPSPAGGYEALAVVQSNHSENVRLGSLDGPVVKAVAVNP